MKKRGVFILFLLVFVVASVLLLGYHELAHQAIYNKFGVDAEISFFPFGAQTQANSSDFAELSESDARVVNALQAANEVYGYQIFVVLGAFFLSNFLLLLYWEAKK